MKRKRMTVAALGATSSIVRWVLRAAMFCTGLLAMLALVIVLVSLMLAMIVATATPTYAASAAHDLRKRFAHRFHLPPSPEANCAEVVFQAAKRRGHSSAGARVRRQRR